MLPVPGSLLKEEERNQQQHRESQKLSGSTRGGHSHRQPEDGSQASGSWIPNGSMDTTHKETVNVAVFISSHP